MASANDKYIYIYTHTTKGKLQIKTNADGGHGVTSVIKADWGHRITRVSKTEGCHMFTG